MQFANYFFASVISFFGLLLGILLIRIAPEEQKPLRNCFVLAGRLLLLLIFIFAAFYYFSNALYELALVMYLALLIFIEYKVSNLLKKSIFVYTVLGILFFLSSKNSSLFAIESSLIMLYGLPAASLMYSRKEKNHYKIIFCNLGFVAISTMLYFI